VALVMARVNASDERMMADARLIASAPELLAALQKAAGALDLYHAYGWPDRAGVRNEIASVVAKATGENV